MASTPSTPPKEQRQRVQRIVGMTMLGSAIALLVLSALVWANFLPFAEAVRGWAAGGIGLAGLVEGFVGFYFLRASAES